MYKDVNSVEKDLRALFAQLWVYNSEDDLPYAKKKKRTLKKIYSYCNSSVARNVNFNLPENLKQVSEYHVSSLLSSLSLVKKAKNWSHQVPFVDAWWPF